MRAIDADELLNPTDGLEHVKFSQEYGHVVLVCDIVYAPTLDVVEKERYDILLEHANILAEELRKYQNADVPERNVGKWIDDCSCSICHWIHEDDKGFALLTNYNFCPNCGADMRKETEDEET